MAGFIPDDKIADVRNAANIGDVISEYVALKKAGRNLVGLCPFHADKAPSFTVSEEKQIFHCFGCGQGGNVFSFLMMYHNLSFPEAVRSLAKRYGIEIPSRDMSPGQRRQLEEKERLFEINQQAAEYFKKALADGPLGRSAREYLKRRHMAPEVMDRFCLGYAPKGWRNLVGHFSSKGVPLDAVEKTGLLIPKSGGYYDRFRDRIMFPITDIHGRVLGFGGRSLDDSLPKYLNSPESAIYHKSQTLYGLREAKQHCRQTGKVFVVEGYFDLLALTCHGIDNVVASLGTALTRGHVRILKGYAEEVTLVFDSDEAGVKAAQRALPLFEQEKVDARIMRLPEEKDPDSYIFEAGGDQFRDMAQKSLDMMEFMMASAIKRHGLSPQGKVKIVEALKGPLRSLEDSVGRAIYVKTLAERLDIDESAILERIRVSAPRGEKRALRAKGPNTSKLEETIVAMMLQCPEGLSAFNVKEIVESLENAALKKVGQIILERFGTHEPATGADLIAQTKDADIRNVISSLTIDGKIWDHESCLKIVNQYWASLRKRQGRVLSRRIKEAEKACDERLSLKLLAEKQRLVASQTPPRLE
ncbi:MAG: DNA primase [Thermodesulfobacteriota bacterium]|nr:DNA primase [Thermodesulfobacteriota bacterium]